MAPSLRKGSVAMDTVKINKGTVRLIAHRGVSGLELENTCAAFVAAGNRSYFGIETDVHVTADGSYIIIHDDTTGRVAEADLPVEETDFDVLRAMCLKCKDGSTRRDLVMPSLEEYLTICKHYEKEAVLELKRISRDFKTPVIGISSLNRASYKEAISMEAFKESGSLEYGSDVLIGLQLNGAGQKNFDANEAKRKNPREIELVILKNRNGSTGDKIELEYYPLFNYFTEPG